ncbi:SDR family NAD(P)-dependent oxidoreductase [Arthrobacter sp. efr-133-TYG-120]|uniref:SDR family NAD(P)-dependent oxidoreductase n=1 Tax=Arthrobacter sp. efr-133-TYG-120 TaxID=3040280 RepID=UPI00254E2802|nr:SDR family NAD(P)-dependent oxidoreductase [Arthrobacter sp. efr-133-TYG-120]
MTAEDRFAGKTIIVTGAGSGIGRATAVRLAEEGARLIVSDVVADRLDDLKTSLPGADVRTVVGDVTDSRTVDAIADACEGRLDGLANIAGIMDGFLPVGELDDETWDRVIRVNVTAPMRLTRAALPLLIESGSGSIVNVASEAALRGSAAGAAYTASKHAVIGLTKNTAFMYGPQGVRANAVAPGAVATNIEAAVLSEFAASRIFPLMQAIGSPVAEAERLAAAITWLLSEDSLNINGAILPSDGGWSAA